MGEVISFLNTKCLDMEGIQARYMIKKVFNLTNEEVDKVYRPWREKMIDNFDFSVLNKGTFKAKNIEEFSIYYAEINSYGLKTDDIEAIYFLHCEGLLVPQIAQKLNLKRRTVRCTVDRMTAHEIFNHKKKGRQ